jgi:hypothetical protein
MEQYAAFRAAILIFSNPATRKDRVAGIAMLAYDSVAAESRDADRGT